MGAGVGDAVDLPQPLLADLACTPASSRSTRGRAAPARRAGRRRGRAGGWRTSGAARAARAGRRRCRPARRTLDDRPGRLPAEPAAALVEEHRLGVVAATPRAGHQARPAAGREPRRRAPRRPARPNGTMRSLRPLAEQAHEPAVEVDVAHRQPDTPPRSAPRWRRAARAGPGRAAPTGSSPTTASSSAATSASLSGLGIPAGTRTPRGRRSGRRPAHPR